MHRFGFHSFNSSRACFSSCREELISRNKSAFKRYALLWFSKDKSKLKLFCVTVWVIVCLRMEFEKRFSNIWEVSRVAIRKLKIVHKKQGGYGFPQTFQRDKINNNSVFNISWFITSVDVRWKNESVFAFAWIIDDVNYIIWIWFVWFVHGYLI